MYGYIYKTIDKTNGLIYVGKRVSKYFQGINYVGSGKIICRIKSKLDSQHIPYSDRFIVELIDTAESKDELITKEIYYINKLDARNPLVGYNLRKGGDCGPGGPMFKGHHHSDETKQKMSKSRIGCNNGNYGNHWHQSDELKALHSKISSGEGNGMYGKTHSEESKLKNKKAHLGKKAMSNIELDKVVMVCESDVQEYISKGYIEGNIHIKSHKHTEESKQHISNSLKGKPKSEEHKKHLSESRLNKYKNNKL